jgi:hypothetical protein
MSRWLFLPLIFLAGCQNIVGPFQRPPARVDDPRLSIPEQEALGRQYLALPDHTPLAGPSAEFFPPGADLGRDLGR